MKVIDLINMINNKVDLPEKMIINKIEFHSNVFKTMIYEEDCNTNIWMAIQLNHIDLDDYVKIMEVELIEDETIDIDNIEEIDIDQLINTDDKTGIALLHINKLIRAVKQLNKEIKELNKKYCCNCGVELTEENTALPNMCNECKYGEEWEQC